MSEKLIQAAIITFLLNLIVAIGSPSAPRTNATIKLQQNSVSKVGMLLDEQAEMAVFERITL